MTSTIKEAEQIIYGDRENTYGSPSKNLETIATYWETYLRSRGLWNDAAEGLFYYDVCRMMSLLKIARLGNDPEHRDSGTDLIGYEALVDRVMRPEAQSA